MSKKPQLPPPPLPPPNTTCYTYQPHKKRYCKNKVAHNTNFCGNHIPSSASSSTSANSDDANANDDNTDPSRRVPCTLDPTHTVRFKDLAKHLLVCTKGKQNDKLKSQGFYRENVNIGSDNADEAVVSSDGKVTTIEAISLAQTLLKITSKLNLLPPPPPPPPNYEGENKAYHGPKEILAGLSDALKDRCIPAGGARHVVQQGGIVGEMRDFKLLPLLNSQESDGVKFKDVDTILELGAGRGMLGLIVSGVLLGHKQRNQRRRRRFRRRNKTVITEEDEGGGENVNLVMVERAGCRRTAETRLRNPLDSKICKETEDGEEEEGENENASEGYAFSTSDVKSVRIKVDLAHYYTPYTFRVGAEAEAESSSPVASLSSTSTPTSSETVQKTYAPSKALVIAKHLCGPGTDLALRSLSLLPPSHLSFAGLAIATCCHGICNFRDLVWREGLVGLFEAEGVKFGEREFEVLKHWAAEVSSVGGDERRVNVKGEGEGEREENKALEEEEGVEEGGEENHAKPPKETGSTDHWIGTSHILATSPSLNALLQTRPNLSPKLHLALLASRLIDYCRLRFVNEALGMETVEMREYCERGFSPMNNLLLGRRGGGDGEGDGKREEGNGKRTRIE